MLGAGYQITQSKIALGSGGLFGKGFLQGSQSQLNYLPEKQTDFVFTMIGEEFGFVGNLAILLVYFAILLSVIFNWSSLSAPIWQAGMYGHFFHAVFIYFCKCRDGYWIIAGCRRPATSYFLWGHGDANCVLALGVVVNISVHNKVQDSDFY